MDTRSAVSPLNARSVIHRDITDLSGGGGYTLAADPAHLTFGSALVEHAKAAGKELGVLFPAYTLAPHAVYPRQLQQGAECLRYTLEELKKKPGNVIIGGDSAGQPSVFPTSRRLQGYRQIRST